MQGFKFIEIIDDGDYGWGNNLTHRDWLNLDDKYSPPKEKRGPTIIGGDKIFTNENKFGN